MSTDPESTPNLSGIPQSARLRVLMLEDVQSDADLALRALRGAGIDCDCRVVDSREAMLLALGDFTPDIILSDYAMPSFSGLEALEIRNTRAPGLPFVILTGAINETTAVDCLKRGADDYVTKEHLIGLPHAVRNALEKKRLEAVEQQARTQLQQAAQAWRSTFDAMRDGVVVLGPDLVIQRCNEAFRRLVGQPFEALVEHLFTRFVHGLVAAPPGKRTHEDVVLEIDPGFARLAGRALGERLYPGRLAHQRATPKTAQAIWRSLEQQGFWQGELWHRAPSGGLSPKLLTLTQVHGQDREVDHYIATFSDISAQKATENHILHLAHHDALTGLPNRLYLSITLDHAIARAQRERETLALLFIDMDHFKEINDRHGHHIGDGMLMEVAQRLRRSVRKSDTVARLGGDEFVVLLSGIESRGSVAAMANKLLSVLSEVYVIEQHVLRCGPSIGIALFPADGCEAEELLKHADQAMYRAKEAGRRRYHFHEGSDERSDDHPHPQQHRLLEALKREELEIFYQPQADVLSGRLVGAEALLRWRHPLAGVLAPDSFIPMAEESGLILVIGNWLVTEVCRQIKRWRAEGLPPIPIAVNLSGRQFRQKDLAGRLLAILDSAGVDPEQLELEISESTLMEQMERAGGVLKSLSESGLRVAIDDVGRCCSPLVHLRRLPLGKLKVDQSFILDIPDDPDDTAVASAIIQMARSLGHEVVAEGVETQVQHAFLKQQRCQLMQGYFYSHPLECDAFTDFLRQHA